MIYVMRHGESTVNVEQLLTCKQGHGDLTKNGKMQASRAAKWFKAKHIHRIFSSPFDRAQQTAGIIADALGLSVTTLDGLRENDCGDLQNQPLEDASDIWLSVFERWKRGEWEATYPGGESYREAYNRFSDALQQAKPDENTIMVSHGGITRAVIPFLCINAAALQRVKSVNYMGMILLESYDDIRYECVSWGLKEHLADNFNNTEGE